MKKISFMEIEEIALRVEAVTSLLTALETGIFGGMERIEVFRTGYNRVLDDVRDIEKDLYKLVEMMSSQIKVNGIKEVA